MKSNYVKTFLTGGFLTYLGFYYYAVCGKKIKRFSRLPVYHFKVELDSAGKWIIDLDSILHNYNLRTE